uniref:Venom allergen 5 n=1 Tax=Ornithodoros erraticus TaxID=265619 RepID=A0A293N5X7_ORNER
MFLYIIFLMPLMHGARAHCRPEYQKMPPGMTHTACKPPPSSCNKIDSGVSAGDKKVILETHNRLRSQIASGKVPGYPPATNMYQLEWDNELADVAQAHADQCKFKHDNSGERFTTTFSAVGQNLATTGTTDPSATEDWSTVIQGWFDEYKLVSASVIRRFSSGRHGHFTQVVWAKTKYIGCGLLKYKKGAFVSWLYTCNYGPAGNYLGDPVYDDNGATCSKCPGDAPCYKATNLCIAPGKGSSVQGSASMQRISSPICIMFSVVVSLLGAALHFIQGPR